MIGKAFERTFLHPSEHLALGSSIMIPRRIVMGVGGVLHVYPRVPRGWVPI